MFQARGTGFLTPWADLAVLAFADAEFQYEEDVYEAKDLEDCIVVGIAGVVLARYKVCELSEVAEIKKVISLLQAGM